MSNEMKMNLTILAEKITSYFEKEEKEFLDTLEKHPFYCESKYARTISNMEGALHFIKTFDNNVTYVALIADAKKIAYQKIARIDTEYTEFAKVAYALNYIDTKQLAEEEMVKQVKEHADYFPDYFKNNVKAYYAAWKQDKDNHMRRIAQIEERESEQEQELEP